MIGFARILLDFKENFDKLWKKIESQFLYFEQDGAPPHNSESNKNLIKKLLGNNYVQYASIFQIWLNQKKISGDILNLS